MSKSILIYLKGGVVQAIHTNGADDVDVYVADFDVNAEDSNTSNEEGDPVWLYDVDRFDDKGELLKLLMKNEERDNEES